MRLFWRHGYEGVSVADLTEAIGIAPPSLYTAFGSKAGLYMEALALYEERAGSLDIVRLASAATLQEGVRGLLERAVKAVTDPSLEKGCMISSGMISCHPGHVELALDLTKRRDAHRQAIADALVQFVDENDARRLARHLAAVLQGISIQARDGASSDELIDIVESVVSCLHGRMEKYPIIS